jgi:hypothetical protein
MEILKQNFIIEKYLLQNDKNEHDSMGTKVG